jgi:hypothetical protein
MAGSNPGIGVASGLVAGCPDIPANQDGASGLAVGGLGSARHVLREPTPASALL